MADIDAAAAAKLFTDAGITVRVPKLDKDGKPIRDPETKRFVLVEEELSADHIVGVRDLGSKLSITVADGQKYQAAKSAKAGK